MLAVNLRIDVPVDQQKIRPSVIIEIEKHGAPAKILRVQAESGPISDIVKGAVAVVAIQRCGVVGKICLEDIELAVSIVIGHRGAHAGLRAPVFIECGAGSDRYVGECSIAVVVIQNARSAVASDENVGPAIVVKIQGSHTE